ncbi:MAG: hypothetical protein AMXMBFR16_10940 [Candidatus Uhrbacteria bacterium]
MILAITTDLWYGSCEWEHHFTPIKYECHPGGNYTETHEPILVGEFPATYSTSLVLPGILDNDETGIPRN